MKNFAKEFKEFITRGNIVEIAIGLTVGTAFTAFVKSFVENFIMPPISFVLQKIAFDKLFWVLGEGDYETAQEAIDAGVPVIQFGELLSNFIDLIIIALVIFLVIKVMNKFTKKKEKVNDDDKNETEK